MSSYLAYLIRFYLPIAISVGIVLSVWRRSTEDKLGVYLSLAVILAVPFGYGVYSWAEAEYIMTEAKTVIHAVAVVALILFFLSTLLFSRVESGGVAILGKTLLLVALLGHGVFAAFNYFLFVGQQAVSATTVLNTEMILNMGAIFFGIVLLVSLVPVVEHQVAKTGRWVSLLFLFLILFFPALISSAEMLLGLMKLQYVELTSTRLSFVGKSVGFSHFYGYVQIGLLLLCGLLFLVRLPRLDSLLSPSMNRAGIRLVTAADRHEKRYVKATLVFVFLLIIPLLYWDLVASQPPKLSDATPVTPNEKGEVVIPLDQVSDGELHRFSYITEDGRVARFFLINRYQDKVRIGVVFDACMICGDMGYIQNDNEVICIACNVRIFLPSIGTAGGCNPIPMEFIQETDRIIITAAELDAGAAYFSEVVEVEVTDPMSGAKLINLKAPYRYDFKGHTYFFENEENFKTFKKEPEKYVESNHKRHFRTEGYK
jgi:uncharacterized membrane protein/YHS domain-containing protein